MGRGVPLVARKLKPKLVNKYFKENQSQSEIEETIEKALEMYFSQNQEIENSGNLRWHKTLLMI